MIIHEHEGLLIRVQREVPESQTVESEAMDYLMYKSGQDFPVIAIFVVYVFFTENDECGDGSIIVGWRLDVKCN